MRAAVFHGRHDIRIEDVPMPVPGPGELLLRVTAVGICGTDAHEFEAGPSMFPIETRHPVSGHVGPMIPGHELAGVVVGRGEGVEGFPDGTLVVSGAGISCGTCFWCRRGRTNLCEVYATVGLQQDGALAEYVRVPVSTVFDVAAYGLAPDVAALAQPMSIAVHAVRRGGLQADEVAVIIGAGGIGAFITHAAASTGATVIVSDLDPDRLRIADALGATRTVSPARGETVEDVLAEGGLIPSVVYEVSGSAPGLAQALALAPRGCRVVLVGLQGRPAEIDVRSLSLRELEIIGTNAHVVASDMPEALRLLAARPAWDDIAPEVLPLSQLVEDGILPLAERRSTRIKTLIDPSAAVSRPLSTAG
jgi:(R,R)-butanediol dehydrogenase / meso-butanediol dehydrogenase / diacetyl reductase